jgi:hypothetical protein
MRARQSCGKEKLRGERMLVRTIEDMHLYLRLISEAVAKVRAWMW